MGKKSIKSQSPQIGSMFPTRKQPPLYDYLHEKGRNPLKSGQCFLPPSFRLKMCTDRWKVAIPSNRVNVSYDFSKLYLIAEGIDRSQSPQIGSMFPTLKHKASC